MKEDVPFLSDSEIEQEAALLLAEYTRDRQPILGPPVPIEEIVELHLQLVCGFMDLHKELGHPDVHGAISVNERRIAVDQQLDPARFPVIKEFDTFDFTAVPNVPKQKLLELTRRDWIDQHYNGCLIGGSGTGKTHAATGIGLALCRVGLRVKFATAASLVTELE